MYSGEDAQHSDELGYQCINAHVMHEMKNSEVIEAIKKRVGNKKAFLTFDIDFLDPAFAPGTGTPVPGGFSTADALAVIRGLRDLNIVGYDMVEVSQPYDQGQITAIAAAGIMQEFLSHIADCIWQDYDDFAYGDIGVFLGRAIRSNEYMKERSSKKTNETLRATVVGAGNYSMDITGCTIEYSDCRLPVKSVPVYCIDWDNKDYSSLGAELNNKLTLMKEEITGTQPAAVSMNGPECPTFAEIETMADILYSSLSSFAEEGRLIVVILKNDIGKALGQALKRRLGKETAFICMDGICCDSGSYIDIVEPLSGGKVLPVVIKTLIFN